MSIPMLSDHNLSLANYYLMLNTKVFKNLMKCNGHVYPRVQLNNINGCNNLACPSSSMKGSPGLKAS